MLINTSPAAWEELNRFNPLSPQTLAPLQMAFAMSGLNLQQDVLPWLGDRVAIALLPAVQPETPTFPLPVVLAPVKDSSQFTSFLDKVITRWGKPQIERNYKGITIRHWVPPTTPDGEAPDGTVPDGTVPDVPEETPSPTPDESPSATPDTSPSPLKAVSPAQQPPDIGEDALPPLNPLPPMPTTELTARGVAIAVLPGAVAASNDPRALEQLIDLREGATLAQNPAFQRTWRHPQTGRSLFTGYGEVAGLMQSVFQSALAASDPSLSGMVTPLANTYITTLTKRYATIDTHLWVIPEGIRGQTNAYYTTPQPDLATPNLATANQIVRRLPAATFLSVNSRNFKQQWQQLVQLFPTDPALAIAYGSLGSSIRSVTGLDPQTDVLPWLDGEYAFFLFPSDAGLLKLIHPQFNMGAGLLLQTSDRPAAEAALKKLHQFVRSTSKGTMAIVNRRVKGQPVVSLEAKEKGKLISLLSYGWISNDTLLVTAGAEAMSPLVPQPYLPLHLNHTFQTATASLPAPNDGYFYVNMGASLAFVYGLVRPTVPSYYAPMVQEVQRVLGTIRSVSTTNSATPEAQRVDSLWVLGKGR